MKAIQSPARSRRLAHDSAGKGEGAPTLLSPGDIVAGKYRIETVVGEGGMGVVYAAHHVALNQRVALKLLLVDSPGGEETVERFVREAQAAARLRTEHVVRVTDAGALDSGLPFLVMEYLQGCDLAELVALDGPLPAHDVADYMLQVLAGLALAHTAGIVHRDLKPANIFLALRGDGSNIIKILDFGISKQKSEGTRWKELTGKALLGTPAYMSPEQLRSSKAVDARADIWSLGVVMYELLSAKLPFDGEAPGEIFAAILEQSPAPLRAHRPDLPPEWDHIVMRCLQRAPDARFQDVGEMTRLLRPLGTRRWEHAASATERVLARSLRSSATTENDLEAAVAVGAESPPPAPASAGFSAASQMTLGTGRTLVADSLPTSVPTKRRRTLWPTVAAAAAISFSILGIGSRSGFHGAARASGAEPLPPSSDHPSPSSSAFIRRADSPPAIRAGIGAPSTAANSGVSQPPPLHPPSAAPQPSGSAAGESASFPPNRRAPPKKPELGARPTFLKSWR